MTKLGDLLFFLSFAVSVYAQPQYPNVTKFQGTPSPNGTVLFSISFSQSVYTYSGFDLQRSTDSAFNFVSVYTYSGAVGGTSTTDVTYYDYPPDPSKKYYYKMVYPNGGQSATIIVDMGSVYGHYKIYEHPIHRDGISHLDFNYTGGLWILDIADPRGWLMYRFAVTQNSFLMNESWFNASGIYFFRLYPQDGSTVIKGKFVVEKGNY